MNLINLKFLKLIFFNLNLRVSVQVGTYDHALIRPWEVGPAWRARTSCLGA